MELRKRRLSDGADVPQKVARRELAKLLEDAEDITESLYAEQDIISRSLRYYKAISPFANHLKLSQHAISTSDDVVEALKAASGAIATLQQHSAWLKSEVKLDPAVLDAMIKAHPIVDREDYGKYIYDLTDTSGFGESLAYFEDIDNDAKCKSFRFIEHESVFLDSLTQLWDEWGTSAHRHAFQIASMIDARLFSHRTPRRWHFGKEHDALEGKVSDIIRNVTPVHRSGPEEEPEWFRITYYNFAQVARAWQAQFREADPCTHKRKLRYGEKGWEDEQVLLFIGGGRDKCFRRANLHKIAKYQKAAWSELRFGVMSTLGCRLPLDLAEIVFEKSLEAEGIPRDVEVYDKIDKTEVERKSSRGYYGGKVDKQPKLEYMCGREMNPVSDSRSLWSKEKGKHSPPC